MTKSPEMEKQLDYISSMLYGRKRSDALQNNVCVTCGNKVEGFRDELSKKEFGISGMCQDCQDSVFGQ